MVRTTSARLLRSCAQLADLVPLPVARFRMLSSERFATAALLQSFLVIGLVLTLALDLISKDAAIAHFVGALAVLMSVYVGYHVICRGPEAPSWSADLWPANRPTSPASFNDSETLQEERTPSELEQIIRLKARVSHELRTPLNAVVGFADMMHREVLGPVGNDRYREYAAHIAESAERFQIATEKTLAVAELLAAPRNLNRTTIELEPLVRCSLAAFRENIQTTGPEWAVAISADLKIAGNRAALEEALFHLWEAGKAMAESHPAVEPLITGRLTGHLPGRGVVELSLVLRNSDAALSAADPEAATGAELSLLLARLGVEAAGGVLVIESAADRDWQATIKLNTAVNG